MEGHFHERVDPDQLAHELYGIMLMHHHAWRLLRDPMAGAKTRTAFEALLSSARYAPGGTDKLSVPPAPPSGNAGASRRSANPS